jgi:hypothetical protein
MTLLAGCSNCLGGGPLEVGGDTPYVRCLAAKTGTNGSFRVGAVSIKTRGRELSLDGLPRRLVLAAFAGPGFGPPPGPATIATLRAAKPDLMLLLGDIGDSAATARATLTALASLPIPTLLLAGGRDSRDRILEAEGALGGDRQRIIDVTTIRNVRIASDTLIPVAGAADGHYATDAQACGYGLQDLKNMASELGDRRESRRWLLAWQAPSSTGPFGVARDQSGVELGSATLAELAKRIAAPGGIFAWPHAQLLRPSAAGGTRSLGPDSPANDLQIVVPRLTGAAMERSDGSRVLPGFALLRLDTEGLRWLEARSVP